MGDNSFGSSSGSPSIWRSANQVMEETAENAEMTEQIRQAYLYLQATGNFKSVADDNTAVPPPLPFPASNSNNSGSGDVSDFDEQEQQRLQHRQKADEERCLRLASPPSYGGSNHKSRSSEDGMLRRSQSSELYTRQSEVGGWLQRAQ